MSIRPPRPESSASSDSNWDFSPQDSSSASNSDLDIHNIDLSGNANFHTFAKGILTTGDGRTISTSTHPPAREKAGIIGYVARIFSPNAPSPLMIPLQNCYEILRTCESDIENEGKSIKDVGNAIARLDTKALVGIPNKLKTALKILNQKTATLNAFQSNKDYQVLPETLQNKLNASVEELKVKIDFTLAKLSAAFDILEGRKAIQTLIKEGDILENSGITDSYEQKKITATFEQLSKAKKYLKEKLDDDNFPPNKIKLLGLGIREIERQMELIFQTELKRANLRTRSLFRRFEVIIGANTPVPAGVKKSLVDALVNDQKGANRGKLFAATNDLFKMAESIKRDVLADPANGASLEKKTEYSDKGFKFNDALEGNCSDEDRGPLLLFFGSTFQTKTGAFSNMQPVTDNMESAIPGFNSRKGTEFRELVNFEHQKKILDSYSINEKKFAEKKFLFSSQFANSWMSNTWNSDNRLEKFKWKGKIGLEQKDGTIFLKEMFAEIDFSPLQFTKDEIKLVWPYVIHLFSKEKSNRNAEGFERYVEQSINQSAIESLIADDTEKRDLLINIANDFVDSISAQLTLAVIEPPPKRGLWAKITSIFRKKPSAVPALSELKTIFRREIGKLPFSPTLTKKVIKVSQNRI